MVRNISRNFCKNLSIEDLRDDKGDDIFPDSMSIDLNPSLPLIIQ